MAISMIGLPERSVSFTASEGVPARFSVLWRPVDMVAWGELLHGTIALAYSCRPQTPQEHAQPPQRLLSRVTAGVSRVKLVNTFLKIQCSYCVSKTNC